MKKIQKKIWKCWMDNFNIGLKNLSSHAIKYWCVNFIGVWISTKRNKIGSVNMWPHLLQPEKSSSDFGALISNWTGKVFKSICTIHKFKHLFWYCSVFSVSLLTSVPSRRDCLSINWEQLEILISADLPCCFTFFL